MDISFCDLCNESVPQADLKPGGVERYAGRLICTRCSAAMTSEGPAPAPGAVSAAPPEITSHGARRLDVGAKAPENDARVDPPVPPMAQSGGGSGVGWVALVFGTAAIAFLVDEGRSFEATVADRFQETQAAAVSADQRAERRAARLAAQILESETRTVEHIAEQLVPIQAELAELRGGLDRQALRWDDLKQELELARADGEARYTTTKLSFDRQNAQLKRLDEDQRFYRDRIIELEEGLRGMAQAGVPRSLLPGGGVATPTDGTPRWTSILPDLEHASAAIRLEAVYALGETKDGLVVPHLLPRLRDEDLFVRLATARILEALQATQAVPNLIDALEDPESAVREAAVGALREITGRNFSFDANGTATDRAIRVRDWRAWWKKSDK